MDSVVTSNVPPAITQCNYPYRSKDDTPRWKKWVEIVVAGSTAGLLLINIFLWLATRNAASAAKGSVEATLRVMRTEQRAWVFPSLGQSSVLTIKDDEPIFVMATLSNTGKTPAINARAHLILELLRAEQSPNWDAPDKLRWNIRAAILPPSYPPPIRYYLLFERDGQILAANMSKPIRDALQNATFWIAVHGRIDYDDVNQVPHWVTFCFPAVWNASSMIPPNAPCVAYNAIDANQ